LHLAERAVDLLGRTKGRGEKQPGTNSMRFNPKKRSDNLVGKRENWVKRTPVGATVENAKKKGL